MLLRFQPLFNKAADSLCAGRDAGLFATPLIDALKPLGRSLHFEALHRFGLFHTGSTYQPLTPFASSRTTRIGRVGS